MKTILHSILVGATAVALLFSMTSCNTTRGVGQDIQRLGNSIERTAQRHS